MSDEIRIKSAYFSLIIAMATHFVASVWFISSLAERQKTLIAEVETGRKERAMLSASVSVLGYTERRLDAMERRLDRMERQERRQ